MLKVAAKLEEMSQLMLAGYAFYGMGHSMAVCLVSLFLVLMYLKFVNNMFRYSI